MDSWPLFFCFLLVGPAAPRGCCCSATLARTAPSLHLTSPPHHSCQLRHCVSSLPLAAAVYGASLSSELEHAAKSDALSFLDRARWRSEPISILHSFLFVVLFLCVMLHAQPRPLCLFFVSSLFLCPAFAFFHSAQSVALLSLCSPPPPTAPPPSRPPTAAAAVASRTVQPIK